MVFVCVHMDLVAVGLVVVVIVVVGYGCEMVGCCG